MQQSFLSPLRYGLNDEASSLFSKHYFEQLLENDKNYIAFDPSESLSQIEQIIEGDSFRNEADVEEQVIRPIFRALRLGYDVQTGKLRGQSVDYAIYSGDSFLEDYSNTILVVEAESYHKLQKRYYIKKQDNSDPIAQIRNYLRDVNERLANTHPGKSVDFGLLTDGAKWRIYSRRFTHNDKEFEQNFLEFDFDVIRTLPNEQQRRYLKLFCYLLSIDGITKHLVGVAQASQNHMQAVTDELGNQVYPALEYIATGLWRRLAADEDPALHAILQTHYGIAYDASDVDQRAELLKIVYDESLVFLLRLLFILFIEDRSLTELKAIKQEGGILDAIRTHDQPIGQLLENHQSLLQNFDVNISAVCREIDRRYNGGIFSDKKHPLLAGFNIDDILFANAIDNLCRVKLRGNIVTVDFSTISIRELGTLYEGLLEYKFAVADESYGEMKNIVDNKKRRLNIEQGDLYLINQNGERKSTGSYYTPDEMVAYLVEKTLGQKITAAIEAETDPLKKIEALYKITVCDPAMGSGHFIIRAFDELVSVAERLIEDHALDISIEDVRARLARHCLYGADINPIAVDIAKMVMWIRIFRVDKPLEFFDSNFVCGDSLIGSYDTAPVSSGNSQSPLFLKPEEYEPQMLATLARRTETMLDMPRTNMGEMKAIEQYYKENIQAYQKNITFLAHLRLTKYLLPEHETFVAGYYEEIATRLLQNDSYVGKLYANPQSVNQKQRKLMDIVETIEREFRPMHWKARFPHIFVHGGFDVILGNPPWDVVKPNRNHFFSDYIKGYDRLETKIAKRLGEELCEQQPKIKRLYTSYLSGIAIRNKFFKDAYDHQIVKDASGKKLSGDANLYKVFIEKAFTILKTHGRCGFVVPSGLNTDQGCTGLRRLLFSQASVEELIMFENRRGIFYAVHRQYKFDSLVYQKTRNKKPAFTCGFYWQDPRWLFGQPDDITPEVAVRDAAIHERFSYPLDLSETISPEMDALIEARGAADIPVLKKIARQPLFGDKKQDWYMESYNEFHMTSDSDLFNTDGIGYPLMEGKTIHQFNADFAAPTRHVISEEGEKRLADRWKVSPEALPSRDYRIAYRSIGRSTDTRTLIATVLPPHVFAGNSLNFVRLAKVEPTPHLLAGTLVILNSLVADYVLRFRVSANVNSYYVKELPFIRDRSFIEQLGTQALPLFAGRDFRSFRTGAEALDPQTDAQKRLELRAQLDAQVAKAYGLTYEEFQHILSRFNLVSDEIKDETLHAYRSL